MRDSGSLEQDGDTILLLHREDYYRKLEGKGQPLDNVLEIIVGKNKDGATGIRPLLFDEVRQIIRDPEDPPFATPVRPKICRRSSRSLAFSSETGAFHGGVA